MCAYNVNALDAKLLREDAPLLARELGGVLWQVDAEVGRNVDERLLHKPRHHARIGAAARDGRRPRVALRAPPCLGVVRQQKRKVRGSALCTEGRPRITNRAVAEVAASLIFRQPSRKHRND